MVDQKRRVVIVRDETHEYTIFLGLSQEFLLGKRALEESDPAAPKNPIVWNHRPPQTADEVRDTLV